MPAQVTKQNTPPRTAPAARGQAKKAVTFDQLCERLVGSKAHPKSQVKVRLTALDFLFGAKELHFEIRDVIITMNDAGKPDLVELIVQ